MLLRAIGIYVEDEKTPVTPGSNKLKPNLRKIKQVQQDKIQSPGIFSNKLPINQLENVDQELLYSDRYQEMGENTYRRFNIEGEREFNYILNSSNPKCVIAISSYRKLERPEKGFLFKNIAHVLLRPKAVNTTLDEIVRIPLNYIGRNIKEVKYVSKDLLIDRVDQELDEVMKKMYENIEKALLRGESLEQLQSKALILDDHAVVFDKKAHDLNRCCKI